MLKKIYRAVPDTAMYQQIKIKAMLNITLNTKIIFLTLLKFLYFSHFYFCFPNFFLEKLEGIK